MLKPNPRPTAIHAVNVMTPAVIATNVRRDAARSARTWARDRLACASATSRMIPASAVLSPIAVTLILSDPSPLTVPAMTFAPTAFSTGRDSPVIIDSLTAVAPSTTSPSAGTRAPGRTRTRSPSRSSETGTRSVPPSVIRSASSGRSLASSCNAPCARSIDRISSQCPSSITVMRVVSSQKSVSPPKKTCEITL